MSKKYTAEELEQLTQFVAQQQKLLGGALVMQLAHFGAYENEVHTEIINKDISNRKYLVSTRVRPLTEELKAEILSKTKQ